jgi:hypothetical protein
VRNLIILSLRTSVVKQSKLFANQNAFGMKANVIPCKAEEAKVCEPLNAL